MASVLVSEFAGIGIGIVEVQLANWSFSYHLRHGSHGLREFILAFSTPSLLSIARPPVKSLHARVY